MNERNINSFFPCRRCQLVYALVVFVPGVTANPFPVDGMALRGGMEALPEFLIFDWLFGGRFPAVFDPIAHPVRDSVFDVLAVGVHGDGARLIEGFQRVDGCQQFHAIVRRAGFATAEFLLMIAVDEQRRPSAGSIGIGLRAAVSVDRDLWFGHGVGFSD